MVIYVDVLFVINFFITYVLLCLTGILTKRKQKTMRYIFASAVGGAYSLVILADELNFLITFFGKLFVAFLIILVAFGFGRLYLYIKTTLVFFFSNMILLGFVIAFWMWRKPSSVAIQNSVVYFDISAKALLICAAAAYLVTVVVIRLYNRCVGRKDIYSLTVIKNAQSTHLFAFCDTGNKLREPFSNYPVIICDESKFNCQAERIIPFDTVGGDGMLKAFKPDSVIINNGKNSYKTDNVYIALSSVNSKEYSAILNPEILSI